MKEASITICLDSELHEAFMREAREQQQPAPELVEGLMRDFVERRREERDYAAFLEEKVRRARISIVAGRGRSHDDVEKDFAERRASSGRE